MKKKIVSAFTDSGQLGQTLAKVLNQREFRISTEEIFWDDVFSGENQTVEAPLKMGKIGGLWLFLFVCFVCIVGTFLFIAFGGG